MSPAEAVAAQLLGKLARAEDLAPVAAAIGAALDEARRRWPTLVVDEIALTDRLAEGIVGDGGVADALQKLVLVDLVLASACSGGDPAAAAVFAREFDDLFASVLRSGGQVDDDLRQRVLARLLVASPDRPPRIREYSGTGSLRAWLRVVATRMRIDDERSRRAEPMHADDDDAEDAAADHDPELAFLKAKYREAFGSAFSAAWLELDPRQRNLLRHQVMDGLSATHLAGLYSVHRATAKRWLVSARADLLAGTRRHLAAQIGVDGPELDSVMRLIESRLDVSARVFLQTRAQP